MSAEIVTQAAAGDQDRRRWLALALIVAAQFMVSTARDAGDSFARPSRVLAWTQKPGSIN